MSNINELPVLKDRLVVYNEFLAAAIAKGDSSDAAHWRELIYRLEIEIHNLERWRDRDMDR